MSVSIGDLGAAYGITSQNAVSLKYGTTEDKTSLNMEDFLSLMIVSLQNQTLDDTMDTSEMMNQMVQMSVVQAITDISTLITDSTTLSYAASLVGKEVTIGQWVGSELQETVGTVIGTGTLSGQQVIFLEDDETPYYLSDILSIGRLPDHIDTSGTGASQAQADTVTPSTDTGSTALQTEAQADTLLQTEETTAAETASTDGNHTEDGFEIVPGE